MSFLQKILSTPSLHGTGLMMVKVRSRNVVMFAPYGNYGQPKLKNQALLKKLKRRGGYYSLVGDRR